MSFPERTGDFSRDLEALRGYVTSDEMGEELAANHTWRLLRVLDALAGIVEGLQRHQGEIEALLRGHEHPVSAAFRTTGKPQMAPLEVRGRTFDGGRL